MRLFVLILCVIFAAPLSFAHAGAVINEVLFDPAGTDTGLEWIELYNAGETVEDMSGWQLYPDGVGYFLFPQGFFVRPNEFVVVRIRASGINSESELWHTGASSNMGNTSGSAALFSGEPGKGTIKSFIQWGRAGETWESGATDAGLWIKGNFVAIAAGQESSSVALSHDGVTTNAESAWRSGVSPTPGVSNLGGPSPQSMQGFPSVTAESPSSSPFFSSASASWNVSAGGDRTVIAGAAIEFAGSASDKNGEEIGLGRYLWNFGDGATAEGKRAVHIFRVPGTYMVSLTVSSGETAVSDYARIQAISNQIQISRVIEGKEGFAALMNPGRDAVDIGGWTFMDGRGRRFEIPRGTILASQGEAGFPNSVTGVLIDQGSLPLTVLYHTNEEAFRYDTRKNEESASVSVRPDVPPVMEMQKIIPLVSGATTQKQTVAPEKREKKTAHENPFKALSKEKSSHSSRSFFFLAAALSVIGAIGFLVVRIFTDSTNMHE